jgi:ubiquitin C-terminal hydrolase
MSTLQDEETLITTQGMKHVMATSSGVSGAGLSGTSGRSPEEESWYQFEQSHPSIIDRLFSGMQKTIVTCGKCNEKSITFNPFMTLSLAFESSLEKCLLNYLKEDSLECSKDGSDQYRCDKCKR